MSSSPPEDKIKKLKATNQVSMSSDVVNINQLNNDCLVVIFKKLEFTDRLKLSLVCKRWNKLCDDSWSNVNKLCIGDGLIKKYLAENHTNLRKNTAFVCNVLKKSGHYLNTLTMYGVLKSTSLLDFMLVLSELPNYCKNLTNLRIMGIHFVANGDENKVRIDHFLEKLFCSNKSLTSLTLGYICINGYCLTSLNPDRIEELKIITCSIESKDYLNLLLSKLKNLKKVEIVIFSGTQSGLQSGAIDALNDSGCTNITDFSIFCESNQTNSLISLILKQKQLRQINFHSIKPSKEFFENIPAEFLETIENLFWTSRLLNRFYRFDNLKNLRIATTNLTDEFMSELKNLVNLKELSIRIGAEYLLTSTGEAYFNRFVNLESFHIFIEKPKNVDNILKALSECKNLKELLLSSCLLTEDGFKYIMLLPNLNILDISFSNSITDKIIIDIILNLVKLEKLLVKRCKNLTNEFLNLLNEIKINRNDNHPIKIICGQGDNLDVSNINKPSLLIEFIKDFFAS